MTFINSKMSFFLSQGSFLTLPVQLHELIKKGVTFDQKYFLFKAFHNEHEPIDKEWVRKNYTDDTGFECAVNSFHLEDYCKTDLQSLGQLANIGLKLLNEFKEYWQENFKVSCVAILTMQLDTEFGPDAVFRFHKKRQGQFWIDLNSIELSQEAIMVMEIDPVNNPAVY